MKKKVFMIVGDLGAGGAERVFWLLSQHLAATNDYEVFLICINGRNNYFDSNIPGVHYHDLNADRALRSFRSLYRLLSNEKPYAVFSTVDHINMLTCMMSFFVKIPVLVGRVTNIPSEMTRFYDLKSRVFDRLSRLLFIRFDHIVCQTALMRRNFLNLHRMRPEKVRIISNPIMGHGNLVSSGFGSEVARKLVVVSRLETEKGPFRLIDVMKVLPSNYTLSVFGEGSLKRELQKSIDNAHLSDRVLLMGNTENVPARLQDFHVYINTSFMEGFSNSMLEALSVGLPVVSYEVSGTREMISADFNGFVVEQDDLLGFVRCIEACFEREWDHKAIRERVHDQFAISKIGRQYEQLLERASI